jgi:hypothetical protein
MTDACCDSNRKGIDDAAYSPALSPTSASFAVDPKQIDVLGH